MDDIKEWSENITPNFVISKSDTKDLVGICKDLDSAFKIRSLVKVNKVAMFIKSDDGHLKIKSILNAQKNESTSSAANIHNQLLLLK